MLSDETLQLIWETCINEHKHEAVTDSILNVIASIANSLPLEMINFIIESIHKLPLQTLGSYSMYFRTFYLNCLSVFRASYGKGNAEKKLSKLIDLNIYWEAIQDETELPEKVKLQTLDVLVDLMDALDHSNTSEFLKKAIEGLEQGTSPIKCMIMIEKVLQTCARRGYPSVFKKVDLIQLAIQSAEIYLKFAGSNSPMDGNNIETTIFRGSLNHKDTISKYFDFISLLLKNDAHNRLSSQHVDLMFTVFVQESIGAHERSGFYRFSTFSESDSYSHDDKKVMTSKVREHLFQNILCKYLNNENTGLCEFTGFESNFSYVNSLKRSSSKTDSKDKPLELARNGIELVQDLSMFSKDESIRKRCNDFLVDLYLNDKCEDYARRGKNNRGFLEEWLEKIQTINDKDEDALANTLALLFNFVYRYDGHHFDGQNFDKLDIEIEIENQDLTRDRKRRIVIKVNREMTVGAIRKKIAERFGFIPSEVLILYLHESAMFDKLSSYKDGKSISVRRRKLTERECELPRFLAASNRNLVKNVICKGLESKNHYLRGQTLEFLRYIPPNSEGQDKMIQGKMLQKKVETEDWLNFLYCSDLTGREVYFGLKIMKSLQVPYDQYQSKEENDVCKENKLKFYKNFNSFDGFTYLGNTLFQFDANKILKDVVWLSIFQMTYDILRFMLDDDSFLLLINKTNKDDVISKSISKTINHGIEMLKLISTSISPIYNLDEVLFDKEEFKSLTESNSDFVKTEYKKLETEFIESLFGLMKSCFSHYPAKINSLYSSEFIKNGSIINLGALHQNPIAMRKAAECLLEFCEKFKDSTQVSPTPAKYFLKLLSSQLEFILSIDKLTHTDYFTLWEHILGVANAKVEDIGDIEEIVQILFTTVNNRPVVEDDITHCPILAGGLLLLGAFDKQFHEEGLRACPGMYSIDFLNMLLSKGLFSRDRVDPSNAEITYPLCKSDISRKNALNLIRQLFGIQGISEISKFINPIIKNGSWRSNKREKWYIQSSMLTQRTTHVGLVNLGCTGYMNSMMQQFFMSSYIRSLICICKDYKKMEMAPEDNVLYQSKYLFANLIHSKMPTYNPIAFFNSIKDSNGEPMPTNEQKDIDEFLSIYMDKIEQNIKGSEDEKRLNLIFGGAFAQELICQDCPHYSSRDEPFISIMVEIKNKSHVLEGLNLFVQGEMLEGSNAYYGERGDKKVDTLKRGCIKRLPNTLILTLKRFEFDLETFTKYKLNSRCEFDFDLDMRDYCQETLSKKNLMKKMKAENLTYELLSEKEKETYNFTLPDIYYKYKLKGVVVHYGTTEGGHYYSFIKHREQNKWYEFNDTVVRDYDLSNLPEDTFGGFIRLEQPRTAQGGKQYVQSEKLHSAYVLIYEREVFLDNSKLFDLIETDSAKDLTPFLNSYKIEEWPIVIDKNIANDIALKFDSHWISIKIYDECFLDIVTDILVSGGSYLQEQPASAGKQSMDVDEDRDELRKLKFAATFLLAVVLRSDSRLSYGERLVPPIMAAMSRPEFALWFIRCFTHRHTINEYFANGWSPPACRVVGGLLEQAVTQVYADEKDNISKLVQELYEYGADKPGGPTLLLIKLINDPTASVPSTLKLLYQFIAVVMAKLQSSEMSLIGQFLYYSVFDLFASLCVEFRMILGSFRIHTLLLTSSFGGQISLEALLSDGYAPIKDEFENEFILEDLHCADAHDSEFDDDLGKSTFYKLSKFDRVVISNLAKDVEPFVFSFKVISKLVRSCQILSEARSKYEDSPYRMDNLRPIQSISIRELEGLVEPTDSTIGVLLGSRGTSKPLRNELAKLYGHALFSDERSAALGRLLISAVNHEEFKDVANYERVMFTVLTLKDSLMSERVAGTLDLGK